MLIAVGVVLVIAGGLIVYAHPLRLGQLPGDVTIAGRGWSVALLFGTSLLLSVIATLVLNLLLRRR